MKTWTAQAGFPLLSASRAPGGELILNQTWYTSEEKKVEERQWHIPVTWVEVNVTNWEDAKPKAWMTGKSLTLEADNFSSSNSLVLLNTLAVGYYRVHYDEVTWMRISEQLNLEHKAIHPLQRAAIICDVVSLVKEDQGPLSQEVMEAVLSYRDKEEDFAPLMAFRECVDDGLEQDKTTI